MKEAVNFTRVLILSFCSMCYQLLIARALAEITNHYIFSYSISFGCFLLGMGIGGIVYGKYFNHKPSLKTFFYIENLIAVSGGLSVLLIFIFFSILIISIDFKSAHYLRADFLNYSFILLMQTIVFLVGFCSGFELPICLKMAKERKAASSFKNTGVLLGSSYIGGFLGSLFVTLIMVPIFGLIASCILVGFINILLILEFIISYKKPSLKKLLFLFIPACFLFLGGVLGEKTTQFYLKSWYLNINLYSFHLKNIKDLMAFYSGLPKVLRIRSFYQNIDILSKKFNNDRFTFRQEGMSLHLNKQFQFSENHWKTYHESIVIAGAHLSEFEPKKILVLGGGDGLLVSKILELYKAIEKIDLVEIDPAVITLAKTYSPLTRMNKHSLSNSKINIIIADAFHYISRRQKKYDAVFIDFPFPKTFDLSRLYSIEFYARLKQLLTPKGFVVLDVPIWKSMDDETLNIKPMPQDILYSTIHYAGYKTLFAFGKNTPFLFLQVKKREKIGFHSQRISYKATEETMKNLVSIDNILNDVEIHPKYINSVFKPRKFRF